MEMIRNVSLSVVIAAAVAGAVTAMQPVPHQSTGMPYDDELYRHLIYDDHDYPGERRRSRVLPYPNPRFYIRLGSATECHHAWRLSWREMHYWRAMIPIVAEQLTGEPYHERVEVGCADRPPAHGWVIVRYVTPEEYERERDKPWGENTSARALVGATHGQIWMGWTPTGSRRQDPPRYRREAIVHEIGHAFGLFHTHRKTAVMVVDQWQPSGSLEIFSAGEEAAARRAYRAGRGARYCGDPDQCGDGRAFGEREFWGERDALPPADVAN